MVWPPLRDIPVDGDIEAAIIDILTSSPAVLGYLPAESISTDQVGYVAEEPWLMVSREGGPSRPPLDFPRVDVQSFAARRSVAADLLLAARAVILASPGYRGHGLTILGTQEEVGPVKTTDKQDASQRYFCSIRLTTRATAL